MTFIYQPTDSITKLKDDEKTVPYGDKSFLEEVDELTKSERGLLDIIWRHGPVSRKVLAELAGVTGASATRLTRRSLDLGLIEESIARHGGVGNPSRPLQRAKSGIFSIGVSFTRETMSLAVTGFEGAIYERRHARTSSVSIASLSAFINESLNDWPHLTTEGNRIIGLGLAVPGYRARTANQWAIHWDFPTLQRTDLEVELSSALGGLPVYAERDAMASIWAERLNGKGKKLDSFCLMYLAQGVGGAVMSGGRPVSGRHGNAGGIGILFPYDNGPRPSAHDLAAHLEARAIKWTDFTTSTKDHMEALDEWIDKIVPILKAGLNNIARLYDPEVIILGGSIPRFVMDRMVVATGFTVIETNNYTAELPAPTITVSDLLDDSLLQGAATLPMAHILTKI